MHPQPEPLKNLNELAKSQVCLDLLRLLYRFPDNRPQLIFFASAAEALSSAQNDIEELSVAAEGEYR